jgi:hypothetical protein
MKFKKFFSNLKLFLFTLPFFFSCQNQKTIEEGVLDCSEDEWRDTYYCELVYRKMEIEGGEKFPPGRGCDFLLSLYYALRDKEDSALKFYYESIKGGSFLAKIYTTRHLKSLGLDEKIKYIREGRKEAREKKFRGLVFDSYLMECLLLAEKDTCNPQIIDSLLRCCKTSYDWFMLEEFMIELLHPNCPEYYGKYLELTKKFKKREFVFKRRPWWKIF